jgi:hypothetical protein
MNQMCFIIEGGIFSMVAMENAMLGNPVVCFDKGMGQMNYK